MPSVDWLALGLARLRDERAASAAFLLVVFVTSLLFALSPRLYERAREEALTTELADARSSDRGIELSQETRIAPAPGDAPTELIAEAGRQAELRLPGSVRGLIAGRSFIVESPRWLPVERILLTTVILRIEQGTTDRVRYVVGGPPTGQVEMGSGAAVFQAALSVSAAAALGLTADDIEAGAVMQLERDTSDPLAVSAVPIAVRFTGLFEPPVSLVEDEWFDDLSIIRPRIRRFSAEDSFTDVVVVISPEAYPALFAEAADPPFRMRFAWRYHIDPARLEIDRLPQIAADVRRMEGLYRDRAVGPGTESMAALQSRLLVLIERHIERWRSADLVLVTAGTGPVGLAAISLGSFAVLIATRRERSLATARARGASMAQVVGASLVETLVLAVPASLLAGAFSLWLVQGPPWEPTATAVALSGGLAVAMVIGAVAVRARSGPRGPDAPRSGRWGSYRRVSFEVAIVAVALGGTLLLQGRGVGRSPEQATGPGVDILLAATPGFCGLAAGLVASRLYPILAGLIGRVTNGRRDLVPALALRRASREGRTGPVLVVLVAAAMIGTFSAAMAAHLERSTLAVAWHDVGASHRMTVGGGALPTGFDVSGISGVEAVAPAHRADAVSQNRTRFEFLAIDAMALKQVIGGTPADAAIPTALAASTADPLPAIISNEASPSGGEPIAPGDVFPLTVAGRPIMFVAVTTRETFATLPVDGPFVVTSLAAFRALEPDLELPVTDLFVRAADSATGALRDAASTVDEGRLEVRSEQTSGMLFAPIMVAVLTGIAASALAAGLYAALAVAAAIGAAGRGRMTEAAQLRTLGLSRRESLGLAVIEHFIPTLVAFTLGTVGGAGLFALVQSSIGLQQVIGSTLEVASTLRWEYVLLLLAALVGVASGGITVAAVAERRVRPTTEIRRGLE